MRPIILLFLCLTSALAQVSNYPYDNDRSLFVTADNIQTKLTAPMLVSDTVAIVQSSTGFVPNMIVTICDTQDSNGKCTTFEHMLVTNVAGNILTVIRGFAGTTARAHLNARLVSVLIDGAHQQALKSTVLAIENTLSIPAVAFPTQSPAGTLSAGSNTITMAPVPPGVNGNDTHHYLYVSGTGAPEACLITGGTGRSGDASGQIIMSCAGSHSAGWQISSATAGAQEAVNIATAGSTAGPRGVHIPGGIFNYYATLYIPPTKDFRIESDNAIIVFPTNQTTDGILIDSCEDCDYRFPLMIYYGSANAVHVKPANPDPAAFTTFVDSRLWVTDIGTGGPTYFGVGNALVLMDTTVGDISHNDIYIGGANGSKYGLLVTGSAGFSSNHVMLSDMQNNTVAQVADNASSQRNYWDVRVGGTNTEIGADIFGIHSEWRISTIGLAPSSGFIVEANAAHNQIFSSVLDTGFTNHATNYNRAFISDVSAAVYAGAPLGFNVVTPAVPGSGVAVTNQNLLPVVITFKTAGTGAAVLVYDTAGTAQATASTLIQGEQFFLGPYERISINYSGAPTWQWRAIQ